MACSLRCPVRFFDRRCTYYLDIGNVREIRSAPRRVKLTSVSARWTELYFSVRNTFTLYVQATHVKRWTQSTTNFWLLRTNWEGRSEGCWVDRVPTKLNCYGYYRHRCCRRRIDNRVTAFLWYRRCITVQLHDVDSDLSLTWRLDNVLSSPTWHWLRGSVFSQPVVVYTLSLTSQLQPCADTSTTPRSPDAMSRPVALSATASTPACRQRRQSCVGTSS